MNGKSMAAPNLAHRASPRHANARRHKCQRAFCKKGSALAAKLVADRINPAEGFRQYLILGALFGFSRASLEAALAASARSATIFKRPSSRILFRSPLVSWWSALACAFAITRLSRLFGLGQIFHFQLFHGAFLRQGWVRHPNTVVPITSYAIGFPAVKMRVCTNFPLFRCHFPLVCHISIYGER